MSKGYCMLSRELMDSEEYFSERFTRMQAYIDLCLLAAYKDRKFLKRGNVVELKAGQLARSEEELAERWKWSRNTVRRFLNEQQEVGNIEQHRSRLITIITVKFGINIEQQNKQQTPPISEQQFEQQIAQLQEEINIRDKEIEKIKKEDANASKKKNKNTFDVREDLSYVDCFEDLWREWLDYKDEIKKQYKTQRGAKSAFSQLKNLSNGDERKAKAILEQSYRKSWDGFFDIKDWDSLSRSQDLFPEQDGAGEQPKYLVINGEIYR